MNSTSSSCIGLLDLPLLTWTSVSSLIVVWIHTVNKLPDTLPSAPPALSWYNCSPIHFHSLLRFCVFSCCCCTFHFELHVGQHVNLCCSSISCLLSFFAWYNTPLCENLGLGQQTTTHTAIVLALALTFCSFHLCFVLCVCVLCMIVFIGLTSVCVSLFAHPALTRLVHAVQTTTWYVWGK